PSWTSTRTLQSKRLPDALIWDGSASLSITRMRSFTETMTAIWLLQKEGLWSRRVSLMIRCRRERRMRGGTRSRTPLLNVEAT
ncbi:hypothetical protein KUCAC02_033624, partial [Chaenocephalus aceratus]